MKKPTNRQHLGRPLTPDAQRLRPALSVRLTDPERVALEEVADALGIPMAQFARAAILESIAREREKQT